MSTRTDDPGTERDERSAPSTDGAEGGAATYRTLDEQVGRLSPAEERFERRRRDIGLWLAPLLFFVVLLIPFDLEQNQHSLAAILALVITWWLTEAIPIPIAALLGVALCVVLEATPPPEEGDTSADVVFGLFTDSTVFLFIGAFIIARAMVVHGLHKRVTYAMLSARGVGNSTTRIIIAFGLVGAVTSPFMSNTAAAAMLLPIALGVMTSVGTLVAEQTEGKRDPERLRFGAALMLVITYGITVGGLLLPIGSPPNLIGRELIEEETGEPLTFAEWFLVALPIVVVMFVALLVIILLLNKPELREVRGVQEMIAEERRKLGKLSRGERNVLLALAFALVFWFAPGLIGFVLGDDSAAYADIQVYADEGVVAIVAAALLFVLPVDWARRRFTLNWNQASQIDWGTIILFGAGITLGSLLSSTGLAKVVGESLSDSLGVSTLVPITIVSVIVAVIISETTSNTASAAIVVPIAISIAAAADVNPTIPALAAIFGANYGFMLPVSTPPNAIVYASGMIPITKMVRTGVIFDIIGAALCVAGVVVMAKVVGIA
jgi:solute carrier family 13 (sodium-dependent dicarboxylate transporter), member 2/3/5